MNTVKKEKNIKTTLGRKSHFLFAIFLFALFFTLGATSAFAATWCSKDPSDVVHVFASGPACTQGRDPSWNICGTCTVWCAIGKDKKAVNAFPTNAACVQSINNSGVAGGSCRQCTSVDIVTINNKLKPYYPNSSTTGFLFNFDLSGILVGNGSSGSYAPLSSINNAAAPTPAPTNVVPPAANDTTDPGLLQQGPNSAGLLQQGPNSGKGCDSSGGLKNPLGNTCDLYQLFAKILKIAEQIGAIIIVLAIIYSGFLFVKAQGNSEELETAKRAFLWTVVGAAVLLGATALSAIIQNTINQL
ncbi:MAG: pilin [Candidatus Pacebacteria bacterium]|nr:pilin [Candidatus Paceibacterota bacterium]